MLHWISRRHLCLIFACVCVDAVGAQPAGPLIEETVEFHIADGATGIKPSPFLTRCVGSGHAWLGLRKDWQDQLTIVRHELQTEFVRFHGLLDDDMGVYKGPGKYDFTNVDKVYDFIVSIGMRPVVEVSFMPAALASGSDTGFYPRPRSCHINPPSDYHEWGRLINALGMHFVQRYGEDEVARWFFEVWNEPNCGFFKTHELKSHRCCPTCADMVEYMKLYNFTANALKHASQRIRIGGPATAQLGHVDDFIKAIQSGGLQGGEVVTSHVYPTDHQVTSFLGVFQSIATTAQKGQAFAKTFLLSEFNSGLYGDDVANHDRSFAAAYLVSFAADVFQKVVDIPRLDDFMASYWTFSDVFEEQGFPTREFQNGFGMITFKGIPKPAYRAMQLLTFGDEVLHVTSNATRGSRVKALAMRIGGNSVDRKVRVFISNLDEPKASLEEANINLIFADVPKYLTLYRIDPDHTNPRETWERMGKPNLQGSELERVMNASKVASDIVQSSSASVKLTVPAWSCAVVEASWTELVTPSSIRTLYA